MAGIPSGGKRRTLYLTPLLLLLTERGCVVVRCTIISQYFFWLCFLSNLEKVVAVNQSPAGDSTRNGVVRIFFAVKTTSLPLVCHHLCGFQAVVSFSEMVGLGGCEKRPSQLLLINDVVVEPSSYEYEILRQHTIRSVVLRDGAVCRA